MICTREPRGHLRLWANPSSLGGFLSTVLAEYAARYPQVRIDLEEALSEDSVRAVQKGLAELAVIGDNVPCEGLESLLCNVDELVLLVPADHALATEKRVLMARALEHDLVTLPRHASLTRKIIAAADAAGTSARVRVQVRSFDAMCRMVACGLGLAVLPKAAAGLYSRALGIQIVALDGLQVARNLLLVMRRRSELSAAAAALVSLIESDLASRASAGAASYRNPRGHRSRGPPAFPKCCACLRAGFPLKPCARAPVRAPRSTSDRQRTPR